MAGVLVGALVRFLTKEGGWVLVSWLVGRSGMWGLAWLSLAGLDAGCMVVPSFDGPLPFARIPKSGVDG